MHLYTSCHVAIEDICIISRCETEFLANISHHLHQGRQVGTRLTLQVAKLLPSLEESVTSQSHAFISKQPKSIGRATWTIARTSTSAKALDPKSYYVKILHKMHPNCAFQYLDVECCGKVWIWQTSIPPEFRKYLSSNANPKQHDHRDPIIQSSAAKHSTLRTTTSMHWRFYDVLWLSVSQDLYLARKVEAEWQRSI